MLIDILLTLAYLAGFCILIPLNALLLLLNKWLLFPLLENSAVVLLCFGKASAVFFASRERYLHGKGRGAERYEIVEGESPYLWPKISGLFFLGNLRFQGFSEMFYLRTHLHLASKFVESLDDRGRPTYSVQVEAELLQVVPMTTRVEAFATYVTLAAGTQLNIVILASVEKMNLMRMIFVTEHWWESLRKEILAKANLILATESFESLLEQREKLEEYILQALPYKEDSPVFKCGVRVSNLRILTANPATEEDGRVLRMLDISERRARIIADISKAIGEAGVNGLQAASIETLRELEGNINLIGGSVDKLLALTALVTPEGGQA